MCVVLSVLVVGVLKNMELAFWPFQSSVAAFRVLFSSHLDVFLEKREQPQLPAGTLSMFPPLR